MPHVLLSFFFTLSFRSRAIYPDLIMILSAIKEAPIIFPFQFFVKAQPGQP